MADVIIPVHHSSALSFSFTSNDQHVKDSIAKHAAKNGLAIRIWRDGAITHGEMGGEVAALDLMKAYILSKFPTAVFQAYDPKRVFDAAIIDRTVEQGGICKKTSSGELEQAFPVEAAPPPYESRPLRRALSGLVDGASSVVGNVLHALPIASAVTTTVVAVGVSSQLLTLTPKDVVTPAATIAGTLLENFVDNKQHQFVHNLMKTTEFREKSALSNYHQFRKGLMSDDHKLHLLQAQMELQTRLLDEKDRLAEEKEKSAALAAQLKVYEEREKEKSAALAAQLEVYEEREKRLRRELELQGKVFRLENTISEQGQTIVELSRGSGRRSKSNPF